MKSPNARRAYAYGPPVRGSERPRLANTSASRIAPAPVKIHARIDTGPAVPASEAGSRNTPEPIMLPTTSAVHIHSPIDRFSFGRAGGSPPGETVGVGAVAMSSSSEIGRNVSVSDTSIVRREAPAVIR